MRVIRVVNMREIDLEKSGVNHLLSNMQKVSKRVSNISKKIKS